MKIEEQAKKLMDSFLKELSSVEQEEQFGLQRDVQMRTPQPSKPNEQFRQAFFANAPKVKDGLVQMEKKQW
jgi:hypothetical protein